MFHRFSTWWRALSVVLLCLATVAWPTAAHAGTTPSFSLVHQEAVATLSARGTSHFTVVLGVHPLGSSSRARVTLYRRIIDRSQLAPIVSDVGTTARELVTTSSFALACASHGSYTFTVDIYTHRSGSLRRTCYPTAPHMKLNCSGAGCDGVYPLRLEVTTNGVTTIKWSLLAIQSSQVVQPLRVDFIETMDPSAFEHLGRSIAVLKAIGEHGTSALTLSADYRTLETVKQSGDEQSAFRAALKKALTSPVHQVVNAPPSNIDFGGLQQHGFGLQINNQLTLSSRLLNSLTGRYVDSPLLLSGTPSIATLKALNHNGDTNVVLPETGLTVAPSNTLKWGAPFHVTGSGPLVALATDSPLSTLVADPAIGSGRRAALTLGTLAFLHFEAPDAVSARTVVIETPIAKTPVAFVDDLLNGLAGNPYVTLTTLAPSFDSALIATNGAPSSRFLAASPASNWSEHNVKSLLTLVKGITSYAQAISKSNIGDELRVAAAAAEITGGPSARQAAINKVSTTLRGQLSSFTVDPSTITLAGSGTSIPITLISRADYTVTADVHLITDRLTFPKGNIVAVTMDSPTKSVRVATSGHNGSSMTLQVIVTTPNGQVTLARAAIQVRIAGTSIVGYFLTIASLLVLAYWWLRTYRKRPKGRHAR
jgi:hypothetical protein